jgi:hypothetical protein
MLLRRRLPFLMKVPQARPKSAPCCPSTARKTCPRPSFVRVNEAVRTAQSDRETAARLATNIEPLPFTPGETAAALVAEHERLGKLIH